MIVKSRFAPIFKPLVLATVLATASSVQAAETVEADAVQNPWSFNLSIYMWFPGLKGNISAGQLDNSVDSNFIDIAGKLRSFPMAFNGHFEAHYERLGFYLDGNYMGMDFKPLLDGGISKGLSTEIGIMDYGVMYRLFGPADSERIGHWSDKSRSNFLDIYAGGRTIWVGNAVEFGNRSVSGSSSFTAPLIGGRIMAEFLPKWFVWLDGNVGGFGADNVSLTWGAIGAVGYRTTLFGVPSSVRAGYKALNLNLDSGVVAADVTFNGPFIGLTGFW